MERTPSRQRTSPKVKDIRPLALSLSVAFERASEAFVGESSASKLVYAAQVFNRILGRMTIPSIKIRPLSKGDALELMVEAALLSDIPEEDTDAALEKIMYIKDKFEQKGL